MSTLVPSGRSAQRLIIGITCAAILFSLSTRGKLMLHTMGPMHVWYHLALFILLGILAMRSSTKPGIRAGLLICLLMLGLSIESIEALRYHIPLEWYDVRTDTSGVAIGAILGWLLSFRSQQ